MRLTTKVAVAVATAVVTLASTAGAQPPAIPNLPNLPNLPSLDVARFQMTIRGYQRSNFEFEWIPGNPCGQHALGGLTELWQYARGKAVVMEFSKLGPGAILVRRVGRRPGDAAFAAPGSVTRHATGFFDRGPLVGCGGWASLVGPKCDQEFPVQSDLRLSWAGGGRLTLERAGHRLRTNPAYDCGRAEAVLNFDELPMSYPNLFRQRTALPARKIFGNSGGFRLELKDKFLPGVPASLNWTTSSEKLKGETTLTFKRLRDR